MLEKVVGEIYSCAAHLLLCLGYWGRFLVALLVGCGGRRRGRQPPKGPQDLIPHRDFVRVEPTLALRVLLQEAVVVVFLEDPLDVIGHVRLAVPRRGLVFLQNGVVRQEVTEALVADVHIVGLPSPKQNVVLSRKQYQGRFRRRNRKAWRSVVPASVGIRSRSALFLR